MLKETRAPAAVVALRTLDEKSGRAVAEGLNHFFSETVGPHRQDKVR
jgi:hypothetical protein